MTKLEFVNELGDRLSSLSPDEVKPILDYYLESIADRMDDGMTEEEAIASLGDPGELAQKHLSEMVPPKAPEPETKTLVIPEKHLESKPQKRRLPLWAVILLIIGFPVWGGIGIGILGAVFGVYVAIWSVLLSLLVAAGSMILGGIAGVVLACFGFVIPAGAAMLVLAVGLSLCCTALGFLLLPASVFLIRAFCRLHGFIFRTIRKGRRT